jgi:hypothetical protein
MTTVENQFPKQTDICDFSYLVLTRSQPLSERPCSDELIRLVGTVAYVRTGLNNKPSFFEMIDDSGNTIAFKVNKTLKAKTKNRVVLNAKIVVETTESNISKTLSSHTGSLLTNIVRVIK